jgi:L-threonylcarbamoyladenylate synthase
MMILSTNTPALFETAIQQAVALLRAGQVVALPTETVYGLAANALDASAVEQIFVVKGRPSHNPIIVHVATLEMARSCVAQWTVLAQKLADAFWPGPLTLVLPKSARIPGVVTAGGNTVGVRWPSHPVTQAVIQRCGFPLAAPSANPSGQVSPTTADHVRTSLGDRIPLIVDGGPAEIGIESTVLDLSHGPPRVLRPGMIHAESLAAVAGPVRLDPQPSADVLRSPGLLFKHYSPKARLVLWNGVDPPFPGVNVPADHVHVLARGQIQGGARFTHICMMPREPRAFAQALYSELHRSDQAGAELIVVEAVPDRPEWHAIADRLRRAAAH